MAGSAAKQAPVAIRRGEVYPQAEFCKVMGWGRRAFVSARRSGLPVRKASFRLYVSGDEAIDWLESQKVAGAR
jgi:hypothetical protein